MHPEAFAFVAKHIGTPTTVLEYGALNINGTVRTCAPAARWHGIDVQPGPGVDEVADAATYLAPEPVECVVCCEVLEHAAKVGAITQTAFANLKPGGTFLMTCATEGRAPHSAIDGGPLRPDEFYRNVPADDYRNSLELIGFVADVIETHPTRGDLYVKATKP
jgi:hypothetical protein